MSKIIFANLEKIVLSKFLKTLIYLKFLHKFIQEIIILNVYKYIFQINVFKLECKATN